MKDEAVDGDTSRRVWVSGLSTRLRIAPCPCRSFILPPSSFILSPLALRVEVREYLTPPHF